MTFEVQVYLGDIQPEFIQVQLYATPLKADEKSSITMRRGVPIPGSVNGYCYRATLTTVRPAEDFTARVVPYHPQARVPNELALIRWQR